MILDLQGRTIHHQALTAQKVQQVDVKNFVAGIYSLRIIADGEQLTKQFVIAR